jgi:hypothetical protein
MELCQAYNWIYKPFSISGYTLHAFPMDVLKSGLRSNDFRDYTLSVTMQFPNEFMMDTVRKVIRQGRPLEVEDEAGGRWVIRYAIDTANYTRTLGEFDKMHIPHRPMYCSGRVIFDMIQAVRKEQWKHGDVSDIRQPKLYI